MENFFNIVERRKGFFLTNTSGQAKTNFVARAQMIKTQIQIFK